MADGLRPNPRPQTESVYALRAVRLAHLADVRCPLPSLEPKHPNNLGNSIAGTGHRIAQLKVAS